MSPLIGKRAIVVGAGMGGLAAAAALADHFEQVVMLERDGLPRDVAHRPGTPQSKHVHALLAAGQRALGELFPGFERDLARAGAVPLRVGLDIRSERPGYDPFPQRDLGWDAYAMSRPLIEGIARQHVAQRANMEVRPRCRAQALVADGAAVTAVRCEHAYGASETLAADLVVDASGRGALTMALLDSIGHARPAETTIGVDVGYATAVFAMPDDAPDWKGIFTFPGAGSSRGVLMLPLEDRRWIATLGGRHGDRPPGDEDGYFAYARGLRTSTFYDVVRHAKREGEIVRYGFPESVWRHFDRLETFPRGLLPFGDAICRFNPVYGQGMSVAAQEACLLRRLLGGSAGSLIPSPGWRARSSPRRSR
jgi:2-polyprenyl-6-methoxyphenol hydroxylase-like FAD-dependent oxidoreductase